MVKDPKILLRHILESIEWIECYTKSLTQRSFLESQQIQDAVVKRLEIIGEACKHLPSSFQLSHPNIPWRDIGDMRDLLIHEYFGIDADLVWDTIQKDLPVLKKAIQEMFNAG